MFLGRSCFVWTALGWLDVWFSGGCHNFPSLSLVSAFSLYCFYRSFSPWFNCPFFFFFCRNHYLTVFDCDCKTSPKFNRLFMLQALGGPRLVFYWSAAWLSWPLLLHVFLYTRAQQQHCMGGHEYMGFLTTKILYNSYYALRKHVSRSSSGNNIVKVPMK